MPDEQRERALYEQIAEKQNSAAKQIVVRVFSYIGLFMVLISAILYFAGVAAEDFYLPSLITGGIGLIWVLLASILRLAIPSGGNYDHYKARIEKYGAQSTTDIAIALKMLEERVAALEKRAGDA